MLVVLSTLSAARCQDAKSQISIATLQQADVIGRTGVPLGKVVVMEVTVVAGDENSKRGAGKYYLRVNVADGVKPAESPMMSFGGRVPGTMPLPGNTIELYRHKHNRDPDVDLDDQQIRELEKGYVGKTLKLLAYETGRFAGIPERLPKDYRPWQDHRFMFVTELVILGDAK
jgi:hypothetical protein